MATGGMAFGLPALLGFVSDAWQTPVRSRRGDDGELPRMDHVRCCISHSVSASARALEPLSNRTKKREARTPLACSPEEGNAVVLARHLGATRPIHLLSSD